MEMNWLQKPWGWTVCLYADAEREFWQCQCLAGGYSSRHFHDMKHNRLTCLDCVLRVTIWDAAGRPQERILGFHEFIDVPPGVEHRFEVLQSGRMWEAYSGRCHPQDIVRRDANGWRPPRRACA